MANQCLNEVTAEELQEHGWLESRQTHLPKSTPARVTALESWDLRVLCTGGGQFNMWGVSSPRQFLSFANSGTQGPCPPGKFPRLPKTSVITSRVLISLLLKLPGSPQAVVQGLNAQEMTPWELTALPVGFGTRSSFCGTTKWTTDSRMSLQDPSCNPHLLWLCSETNRTLDFILVYSLLFSAGENHSFDFTPYDLKLSG